MKSFAALILSAAVAIAQAIGPLAFNDFPGTGAVTGTEYKVTYTAPDQDAPVTILLRNGDPKNLDTVSTLTTTTTGGVFYWTPSSDLVTGDDYALEIHQGESVNWTSQFNVDGLDKPVEEEPEEEEPKEEEPEEEKPAPSPTQSGAHGTGLPGTGVPQPTGSGTGIPRPPKPTPGGDDDEDDVPPPFDGAASKAFPSVALFSVLFGAIAFLA